MTEESSTSVRDEATTGRTPFPRASTRTVFATDTAATPRPPKTTARTTSRPALTGAAEVSTNRPRPSAWPRTNNLHRGPVRRCTNTTAPDPPETWPRKPTSDAACTRAGTLNDTIRGDATATAGAHNTDATQPATAHNAILIRLDSTSDHRSRVARYTCRLPLPAARRMLPLSSLPGRNARSYSPATESQRFRLPAPNVGLRRNAPFHREQAPRWRSPTCPRWTRRGSARSSASGRCHGLESKAGFEPATFGL